jgi:Transposase DDE domain
MPTAATTTTVNQAFFEPLEGLTAKSPASQLCPEFSDDDYVRLGVQRVLENSESGRAFLQEHGVRFENTPDLANYFAALRSPRRCEMLRDVSVTLISAANSKLHDRLADIPELANYECFACDGHWHKAAVHDPRHEGSKMAVGHFYSLNLRTHTLRHLAAGEGLHEHDMSALKRIKPKGLRQGVPKGKRVLTIYDKAGIDFAYWKRCRQECAVYFISRVKENMVFDWLESVPVDSSDRRNAGVTEDRRVATRDGHHLRIIFYTDPQTGEKYEFLTNEPDLPPGVIVELYRRRWEAEKTFDEIKNKLGEKKAWATSLVAKEAQALFIGITHNLLLLYEQRLENQHGVTNQAEDQRRAQRIKAAVAQCEKAGQSLSTLVTCARRATQRSVKFVRWIRQAIRDQAAEAVAVLRLMDLYATL